MQVCCAFEVPPSRWPSSPAALPVAFLCTVGARLPFFILPGCRHVTPQLCCDVLVCVCLYVFVLVLALVQLGEFSSRATASTLTQAQKTLSPQKQEGIDGCLWDDPLPYSGMRFPPGSHARRVRAPTKRSCSDSARLKELHTGLKDPLKPMPPHVFVRTA